MAEQAVAISDRAFGSVQDALTAEGSHAALDRLTEQLDAAGDYRGLLDAHLLRARHELGLPLISTGPLSDMPEPQRTRFEERYVEVIRIVGSRYLESGDIPTAWAYFRAIGESDRVAHAILNYNPEGDEERLGAVIEVAFNHGVSPLRGFELILDHYGTCSAITAFEQLPAQDHVVRVACASRLIARLHKDLVSNVRSEIESRVQLRPPDGASIASLLVDHDWLFADESYHVDISHLASVVRMSTLVTDHATIALAFDLSEYGRRLSPRLQFEGPPPFERIFDDHGVYLGALLGRDVEGAISHFRSKLASSERESGQAVIPAQTLVNLLVRLDRIEMALDVASEYLSDLPDSSLFCPGVAQLCMRTGDSARLATISRQHGDLVNYTAALLMSARD